jgi:GNAT superfamily N-acetyltransferase
VGQQILTRPAVAAFWAERLGCPAGAFDAAGLTLVPHPSPQRFYALAAGAAVVVAAPESLHARARAVADPQSLVTPEVLRALLPGAVLVGPAVLAYLHRALDAPEGLERLDAADDARLLALRARVAAEEWQHANLAAAEPPLFAHVRGGAVVAASGFQRLAGRVAHIGVLTDPEQRGRGLGRAVVRATAAQALALGLLPQYQTLVANSPALRIAQSLGFERFATSLSARMA